MDSVFESHAVGSPPTPPASPSAGHPTNGVPGVTPMTIPGDWWFYMLTQEVKNAIIALGGTPDYEEVDQLAVRLTATLAAINAAIAAVVTPDASTTVKGKSEFADTAETRAAASASLVVTCAGFGAAAFGVGQTWQDMTGSRVAGNTYTNTTGKAIMVMAQASLSGTTAVTGSVGGTVIHNCRASASDTDQDTIVLIVPAGATYSVSAFTTFYELR